MATKNATYRVFNGTEWVDYYLKTSAAQVGESSSLTFVHWASGTSGDKYVDNFNSTNVIVDPTSSSDYKGTPITNALEQIQTNYKPTSTINDTNTTPPQTKAIKSYVDEQVSSLYNDTILDMHGDTISITSSSPQTIKEYVDERYNLLLNSPEDNSIDSIMELVHIVQHEETGLNAIMAEINDIKKGSNQYYGTCSTVASTAAKVVACEGFELTIGARISVKFTQINTSTSPTLNVNNTGAKNIQLRGFSTGTVTNIWTASSIVSFVYDGTYWVLDRPGPATTSGSDGSSGTGSEGEAIYGLSTLSDLYLNGSKKLIANFYAPTTAGTSGYFLKSNGSGEPTWAAIPETGAKVNVGSTTPSSQKTGDIWIYYS